MESVEDGRINSRCYTGNKVRNTTIIYTGFISTDRSVDAIFKEKKMAEANKQLLTAKSTRKKSSDSTHCERIQTRVLSKHCTGDDFLLQIR